MDTRTKKYKNLTNDINKELKKEKTKKRRRKRHKFLIIFLIIISLVLIYARFIEPSFLKTNEIKITSEKIDDTFHGLKIVHFSDLHYGMTVDFKYMKRLVNEINTLKPDIVLFTGDLIEDGYKLEKTEKEKLIKYLSDINSTYGKYAIIGNHDYFNEEFPSIITNSGFNFLNNSYDIIYKEDNSILIYGVDDAIYSTPVYNLLNDEELKNTDYKIMMVHEPDIVEDISYNYDVDLIVAGHSHNKQVNIPFIKAFWLPYMGQKYYDSYYNINNTDIYVSNGIGTSTVKFRMFSIPSINFYRITKP